MSTITMVETISTTDSSPSLSLLNKKRPLDFFPNKTPSPNNSGKFASISSSTLIREPGKMKCSCCANLVGVLTCRNIISGIEVRVPKTSRLTSVLKYAGFSAEGTCPSNAKKQNQDAIVMMEDIATNSLVLACLDGHGLYGDKLSQAFKLGLENRLFSHPQFQSDPKEAICSVLGTVDEELRTNEYRIADFSGTTLSLLMVRGNKLLVANVGDSRSIIGRKRNKHHHHHHRHGSNRDKTSASPSVERSHSPRPPTPSTASTSGVKEKFRIGSHRLSHDHKPDRPDEYRRILGKGGRVFSVRYEDGVIGPARVWLPSANIPGLAMSRSLGDAVVHTVGVISTPEFEELELSTEEDCMLVVATDGLWDFVSNEEVCKIVAEQADPGLGVRALLEESRKRWVAKEEMVDDTTICVVHLKAFETMWEQNLQYHSYKSSSNGSSSNGNSGSISGTPTAEAGGAGGMSGVRYGSSPQQL